MIGQQYQMYLDEERGQLRQIGGLSIYLHRSGKIETAPVNYLQRN